MERKGTRIYLATGCKDKQKTTFAVNLCSTNYGDHCALS